MPARTGSGANPTHQNGAAKSADEKPTQARNLVRAFEILDIIAETPDGWSLADISTRTGIPEPTAHRLLGVLADRHMVRVGAGGRWQIGRHCLELGAAYLESVEIRDAARDLMEELSANTEETCALGILDGTRVVYIEKVDSPHPVRMQSGIGRSNPAVSTSLGRAILAWSSPATIDRILAAGLPHRTEQSIVDEDTFRHELDACRERGYSLDDAGNELGVRGVGAPILDYRGQPVAALSIAGPTQRVTDDRLPELGAAVAATARTLSERLGYSPRISPGWSRS